MLSFCGSLFFFSFSCLILIIFAFNWGDNFDIIKKTIHINELLINISITVVVLEEGQRLDQIAGVFYGDSSYWWAIAAASGIGWALQVPPGTVLRVPKNIGDVLGYLTWDYLITSGNEFNHYHQIISRRTNVAVKCRHDYKDKKIQ